MRKILAALAALTLLATGCSVRPQNGTTIFKNTSASRNAASPFDLKRVDFSQTAEKSETLLGWRGNGLMVYDSQGIYWIEAGTNRRSTLFTPADGKLASASLSENGQKILYFIVYAKDKTIGYLADSDCATNRVEIGGEKGAAISADSAAYGKSFGTVWSDNARYLIVGDGGYVLWSRMLDTFTGNPLTVKNGLTPVLGTIYDIDDQTGRLLTSLSPKSKPGGLSVIGLDEKESVAVAATDMGDPYKASFLNGGGIVFLSGDTLYITRAGQSKPSQAFSGIGDYALSPDRNFICLVSADSSGSSIYAAQLEDGVITNKTLVYKGFQPLPGKVFFSEDNAKLCLSGARKETPDRSEIMVLYFK